MSELKTSQAYVSSRGYLGVEDLVMFNDNLQLRQLQKMGVVGTILLNRGHHQPAYISNPSVKICFYDPLS